MPYADDNLHPWLNWRTLNFPVKDTKAGILLRPHAAINQCHVLGAFHFPAMDKNGSEK